MMNQVRSSKAVSSRIRRVLAATIATAALLSTTVFSLVGAQAQTPSGGTFGSYRIYRYQSKCYTVNFVRGAYAEVGLEGDGSTDLDLYVYNERGQLVDYDDDETDTGYASFYVPRDGRTRTATYTIKVVNRHGDYNDFDLFTD